MIGTIVETKMDYEDALKLKAVMSKDEARHVLTHFLVKNNEDGSTHLVATDTHRLVRITVGKDEELGLADGIYTFVTCSRKSITVKLGEGLFPNYERIIPDIRDYYCIGSWEPGYTKRLFITEPICFNQTFLPVGDGVYEIYSEKQSAYPPVASKKPLLFKNCRADYVIMPMQSN